MRRRGTGKTGKSSSCREASDPSHAHAEGRSGYKSKSSQLSTSALASVSIPVRAQALCTAWRRGRIFNGFPEHIIRKIAEHLLQATYTSRLLSKAASKAEMPQKRSHGSSTERC